MNTFFSDLLVTLFLGSAFFSTILAVVVNWLPKNRIPSHTLIIASIIVLLHISAIVVLCVMEIIVIVKVIITISQILFCIFWSLVIYISMISVKKRKNDSK